MSNDIKNFERYEPIEIKGFDEAVEVLGGTNETARLLGRRAPQVSQWRSRYRAFPAEFYLIVDGLLRARGFTPARTLFTFQRPPRRRTTRAA